MLSVRSREIRRRKLLLCLAVVLTEEKKRKNRSEWVKPFLLRREERGMHRNLFLELALEDPNRFRRCLRMDTKSFEYLLEKITPLIQKQDTHLRKSIPADERLSITLRHLATGETQESLRLQFRVGQSTISQIVKEVSRAICDTMAKEYMRMPTCEEEWKAVANNFGIKWNFYNCIGAMDGKHFKIDPPVNSGSLFYNYKGDYSIVLLALVDAQLRFIFVDIGTNGRVSDNGIWNKSLLRNAMIDNRLHIPEAVELPETEEKYPFVIIGDEGFPLSSHVLIPYPGDQCKNRIDCRIFNYRLSRARRCSENAFGVLSARFQIFRSPMRYDPDDARIMIFATICIHNWLRSQVIQSSMYTPPALLDDEDVMSGEVHLGEWRQEPAYGMQQFARQGGNHRPRDALLLRDKWCNYFNGIGAVPWQEKMVQ